MGIAFSIPNYPSFTSTTPNQLPILFIPNVKFILKFIEGDLGIAKKIVEKFNQRSLTQIKDKGTLEAYTKISGVKLGRSNINSYFSNGKFVPPASISVAKNSNNLGGLDALERALITSIFESYKPYIEIIKLVVQHFVIIEDIVAHVLCVAGSSKKPRGNPRALGYQGSQAGGGVGRGMDSLNQLVKKQAPKNKVSDANGVLGNITNLMNAPIGLTLSIPFIPPFTYITQSVVYSTGDFDPDVQYRYIYKDYFEAFNPVIGTVSTAIENEDEAGKDESFILGVYDSEWNSLGLSDNKITKFLDFISDKYKNNLWPQLKPDIDFDYVWVGKIFGQELYQNVGGPGSPSEVGGVSVNWSKKVYTETDGPFLEVEGEQKAIKKGQEMIALNSQKTITTLNFYKQFYLEYTEQQITQKLAGQPATYTDETGKVINTKDQTISDINTMLSDYSATGNLVIQLEGVAANNFMYLSSQYTNNLQNPDKFKTNAAFAFKPKKNTNGVWVDPDTEYDMKIIKCDSTPNITFLDVVNEPEKTAVIRRFIDKNLLVRVTNNQKIGFIIGKDGTNKIFTNLSTLNIDFFKLDGAQKIAFIELGEIFDPTTTNNLPIEIFQETVSPDLETWWNAGSYNLDGLGSYRVEYKWAPIANSSLNSGLFSNQEAYYLKSRYLTGSNYVDRGAKISDTPLQSIKQEFSGSNNFPGLTGELWKMQFNGKAIYVDKGSVYIIFKGAIKSNVIIFEIPDTNRVRTIDYDPTTNTTVLISNTNVPNQVRIEDTSTSNAISRVISNSQITNNQLRKSGPLGTGPFGSPKVTSDPGESARQNIEQIYRFQRFVDDVETFYFVEAVLKSKNPNKLLTPNAQSQMNAAGPNLAGGGGGGGGSYSWDDIFSVIPKFIRLVISLATKLFPVIQQFVNLITNPAQFVSDIIFAKLGDDFGNDVPKFGFFSKDFIDQLKQLKGFAGKVRASQNNAERLQEAKQNLKDFMNLSLLKNYVFVDDMGKPKFLLDGSSTIRLFGDAPIFQEAKLPGITFGLETNLGSLATQQPKVPLKLIFSLDRFSSSTQKSLSDFFGITNDNIARQMASSTIANANLNPSGPLVVKNTIETEKNGVKTIEEISIQYSTGVFREGVDYKYIYLYEETIKTIEEAKELESQGDNESISKAITLIEDALKINPNNLLLKEKLDNLRRLKSDFATQPLLDFMLNMVTLPLKVIVGIILYLIKFFKSLTSPFKIASAIVEFLSFAWIIRFFNPMDKNSMFGMLGLLFDVPTFFKDWLPGLINKTKNKFNVNDIISLPWMTFPTFTLDEFYSMLFGSGLPGGISVKFPIPIPILILSSILCLIEAIINSVIDLIWAIFGMVDPETGRWIVLKPPYIKLCKDTNKSLSPKDILNLLNLKVPDMSSGGATGTGVAKNPSVTDDNQQDDNTFNFIYDIKTSDGRSIMDLDDQELQKFMDENKDLLYSFNF